MTANHSSTDLNAIFHALADDTRRDILARLTQGSLAIGALAEAYNMSLAAVSKHVHVLEDASLVSVTKQGRTRYCTMQAEPLDAALRQIEFYKQFWLHQLDTLQQAAETQAVRKSQPNRRLK